MCVENQVLPERRQIFGFVEVPVVIPNISFPSSRVRISDFLPPPIITQPARPSTRALNVLTLIKFQLLRFFDKADITNMIEGRAVAGPGWLLLRERMPSKTFNSSSIAMGIAPKDAP
jgi:hypothetical protein